MERKGRDAVIKLYLKKSKKYSWDAGARAQWLRAVADFPKDLVLVSSTHIV